MLAKIRQLSVDERARRLRHEHLAAVTGGGDPRRQMDVLADIALPTDVRAPGMHAHAHADRTGRQRPLGLAGGLDRLGRRRERNEERVPLSVDFDAAPRSARLADDATMLGERVGICLCAELAQKPRRSFYVGEEEGDGAGRKVVSHEAIICRTRRGVQSRGSGERIA